MKNKTGKLIILSAPSGAGKTTICKNLLSLNDSWKYSISATTRPIRAQKCFKGPPRPLVFTFWNLFSYAIGNLKGGALLFYMKTC